MTRRTQFLVYVTAALMMAAFMTACGSKTTTVAVSSTAPGVVYAHTAVVKGGVVNTWGYNGFGQLGTNNITNSPVPVIVQGLPTNMSGVSAGGSHTLAFKNMSGVFAWGNNAFGQLGNGNTDAKMLPVPVLQKVTTPAAPLTNITAVSAGGFHSLALDNDRTVWAWGYDANGQLGDNETSPKNTAVKVLNTTGTASLSGVTMIAAGGLHSLALTSDTTVWAWGDNTYGQLGNGLGNETNTSTNKLPVQVLKEGGGALDHIIAIAAGGSHSLALDDQGHVWAWGLNVHGQLGLGKNTAGDILPTNSLHAANRPSAVQIVDLPVILVVSGTQPLAAGLDHSLVLDASGNVWAWGLNFNGQLGNAVLEPIDNKTPTRSTTGVPIPVQVLKKDKSPLSGMTAVVAVGNHSLASDGATVLTWGDNTFGQLGINTSDGTPNGTTTDSSVAVPVTFP